MKSALKIAAIALSFSALISTSAFGEKLVILHTNDTHSQLDPTDDDNLGGILRRKVVIDSVRAANDNVLLVDVGDVVQGTLYFSIFDGVPENKLMNELGYDYRILGNHEFDNGEEKLAALLADVDAKLLTTNYDLSESPLKPYFAPYDIKEVGDKKIGFIALNLDPKGMISAQNAKGVKYMDILKAANSTAWHLKHNEGVDMVVALTHIGYEPSAGIGDVELAKKSEDIDVIIGGHSHTLINPEDPNSPASTVLNADGKPVLITQVGRVGKYIGEIDIDLDTKTVTNKDILVDKRLDAMIDKDLAKDLDKYRVGVDSIMSIKVAKSKVAMPQRSAEQLNFASDFVRDRGKQLADNVDFAIFNKGSLRRGLPKGNITEGMIIETMPFFNYIQVVDLKGQDVLDILDVMATTNGNGLSSEMDVTYDPATKKVVSALLNGQPIDPDKTYRVASVSYLVEGGDYMTPFTNGKLVASSKDVVYRDLLNALKKGIYKGKTINPSSTVRMRPAK
jgi:5'-nucleotidase